MKRIAKVILVVSALFAAIYAQAQNKVEVTRDYTQDISKIKKSFGTNLSDTLGNNPLNLTYSIFDKKLQNIYGFSPLPSSSIKNNMKAEYPSLIATGTLTWPLGFNGGVFYQPDIFKGEAAQNNSLSFSFSTFNVKDKRKLLEYGYPADTKSVTAYPNKRGYKGADINNTAEAGINYTHSWDWAELDASVFAKGIYSTYYGLDYVTNGMVNDENIKKIGHSKFAKNNASHDYSLAGFSLNFNNALQENSNFLFNANLTYSNGRDKARLGPSHTQWGDEPIEHRTFKLNENYLKFEAEGGPTIGKYSMVTLGVTSESAFNTGLQKFNASLLDFTLQYQLVYKGWAFNLGAKASINFNSKKGWDHYHSYVMPKADVSYALSEGRLWLYGSVEGNNYLNNYSSLMEITNWVFPGTTMKEGSVPFSAKGGLKGFIAKDLSFDVNGGYAKHRGLLQFVRWGGGLVESPLDAYYSSHNEVFIEGELSYAPKGFKIELNTKFSQFSKYTGEYYQTPTTTVYRNTYPVGRPKFEANLLIEYNHRERLFVGLNAYARSRAIMYNYLDYSQPSLQIVPLYAKSYVNLSVYGRYVINNHFTAFAQVGNLLNAKIQNYGTYLERGVNAGLGVLIKF